MEDRALPVLLRFAPMIYGPTLLFALGQGALVPMIPIIATGMGTDLALAGLVASMIVVGQLVGNIPAGALVARVGERITMISAGIVGVLSLIGIIFSPAIPVLALCVFVLGFCASAYGLARHAFMTTRVPLQFRARALALLGGTFRLGALAGPFLSLGLMFVLGTQVAAAYGFAVLLTLSVLLVSFGPDPETQVQPRAQQPVHSRDDSPESQDSIRKSSLTDDIDTGEPVTSQVALPGDLKNIGVFATMWQFKGVLSRLGLASASMSAVRASRTIVLPIWGLSLGLDAEVISLVVGLVGAIDFAMFYVSGQVMDRYGRAWAAIPSMILIGTAFLALAFTFNSENATMWFALFAAMIGVGNGLSSGTLLTIGADIAPAHNPAPFLSSWRTVTDAGGAITPLLFSGIAAVSTLSVATGMIGVIGLVGALGFLRWMPKEPR